MPNASHSIIVGAGIAGLTAALELLTFGAEKVVIIDRDTPERIGGLARWAFGGMALCGTDEQKRQKIPDNPERLLADWHSFANFSANDHWPKAWAHCYAEDNYEWVYRWLKSLGCRFLPAVNWVERGLNGEGNSLPRYHVLWGTGWQLVETLHQALKPFITSGKLEFKFSSKVIDVLFTNKTAVAVKVLDETYDSEYEFRAAHIIIACGGINGSLDKVRQHWDKRRGTAPESMLNGASPLSDGQLHDSLAKKGAKVSRASHMWNYAAGIPHPEPEFEQHGLSLIPCKSALWLDATGKRIGPVPLVTGFDTNFLCQQVAKQQYPWTWQILNWKIALKELAVSGSVHNPSIRDHKMLRFLGELLFGNKRLVTQLAEQVPDFIVAEDLPSLIAKMNEVAPKPVLNEQALIESVSHFDRQFSQDLNLTNDDQIRRILHCRQWRPDRLRTLKPAPITTPSRGPLVAIRLQLISRKSLGGFQTNLSGQVLDDFSKPIAGLYAIGEAAGFGGGGASGARSLEGTFLSGCILTARKTATAIMNLSR